MPRECDIDFLVIKLLCVVGLLLLQITRVAFRNCMDLRWFKNSFDTF